MMPSQEEMDREYQRELNAALQARLGDLGINPIPPEIERILAEQEEQLLRAAAAIAPATQAASYHLHQHRMEELRTLGRLGRSGRTPPVDHPREPATPQRDTGPPVLKPIAVEEREDLRPRAPATRTGRPSEYDDLAREVEREYSARTQAANGKRVTKAECIRAVVDLHIPMPDHTADAGARNKAKFDRNHLIEALTHRMKPSHPSRPPRPTT